MARVKLRCVMRCPGLKSSYQEKGTTMKNSIQQCIFQGSFSSFGKNFISGKIKYFKFGAWSISYNCLHEVHQNEVYCGCYFTAVIWIEMQFHFG